MKPGQNDGYYKNDKIMRIKTIFTSLLTVSLLISCTAEKPAAEKEISYEQLRSKIAGAWLGQMVGNIYGLEYENKFIEGLLSGTRLCAK